MPFAELEAVTVDGFGTLLRLDDPAPALTAALAARGVRRPQHEVAAAFAVEASYYRPRAHLGRDEASLARLRRDCVAVFLDALDAGLPAESFVEPFIDALRFAPVAGAVQALERLARHVRLAVIANWDRSLHEQLARLGLAPFFAAVVTSAEAGVPKPDPAIFLLALQRLGVEPARALHVGDEPADEEGARAAGMRFLPAPLATAFEDWP